MKRILLCLILFNACQESETENGQFTGNQIVYPLSSASSYPVSGSATIKQKKDGSSLIKIELTGTEGNAEHPVHLHIGSVSTPNAAILAILNPVIGSTGVSQTELLTLSDETPITYEELIHLDGSIKVHLSAAGEGKNIVLAAGNIGSNLAGHDHHGGRLNITVCKSE